MATVRISAALVTSITTLARSKMRPAVDKALHQRPDDIWGQTIYDTLFGEVRPILDQLPSCWKNNAAGIEVKQFGEVNRSHSFPIVSQPWPFGPFSTPLAKRVAYGGRLELRQHPAWEELFAVMGEYFGRIDAAEQREIEFVTMVRKLLEAHSTLSPALKAWPPLWDLIPDTVQDRHREIVERTKSDKVDVRYGHDLGKMTAMVTAVKFGL